MQQLMRRVKDRRSDTEMEEGDEDVSAMFCRSVVVQQNAVPTSRTWIYQGIEMLSCFISSSGQK